MKWVVGIDEVGRGALAGPVVVAAAMFPVDRKGRIARTSFRTLKDSKKLTAARREFWAKELADSPDVRFALARVYPRGIERTNISAAANLAARRAFSRLMKDEARAGGVQVYLDGGLFLGSKAGQAALAGAARATTMVKADEKVPAVAAASILAKVSRDRFMMRLAKKYPGYAFEVHKGYGTAAHLRALEKNGACAAHRLTFLVKRPNIRG